MEALDVLGALAQVLINRGFDEKEVAERLQRFRGSGNEQDFWERWAGPAVDNLAYALGFDSADPD